EVKFTCRSLYEIERVKLSKRVKKMYERLPEKNIARASACVGTKNKHTKVCPKIIVFERFCRHGVVCFLLKCRRVRLLVDTCPLAWLRITDCGLAPLFATSKLRI